MLCYYLDCIFSGRLSSSRAAPLGASALIVADGSGKNRYRPARFGAFRRVPERRLNKTRKLRFDVESAIDRLSVILYSRTRRRSSLVKGEFSKQSRLTESLTEASRRCSLLALLPFASVYHVYLRFTHRFILCSKLFSF